MGQVLAIDPQSASCAPGSFTPMLKQRSGRIISMSSVVGIIGMPTGELRGPQKQALSAHKTIAKEVASRGLRQRSCPGFIDNR